MGPVQEGVPVERDAGSIRCVKFVVLVFLFVVSWRSWKRWIQEMAELKKELAGDRVSDEHYVPSSETSCPVLRAVGVQHTSYTSGSSLSAGFMKNDASRTFRLPVFMSKVKP